MVTANEWSESSLAPPYGTVHRRSIEVIFAEARCHLGGWYPVPRTNAAIACMALRRDHGGHCLAVPALGPPRLAAKPDSRADQSDYDLVGVVEEQSNATSNLFQTILNA
jgi:hypothetical protein